MEKIQLWFLFLIWASSITAQPNWVNQQRIDLKNRIYLYDEFISGNTADNVIGSLGWRRYLANGASAQQWSIPSDGVYGAINIATGTTVNGGGAIYFNFNQIGNGTGKMILRFRMKTTVASGLTWIAGFVDNVGISPTITDGAYFFIDTSVSTNWMTITKAGGSSTTISTGKALDTNWHWFRIELTASSATFLIDDDVVATILTNIPNGDGQLFGISNNGWTLDAISKTLWIDVFELKAYVDR